VGTKSRILDAFERELQARHGLSLAEYSVLLRLSDAQAHRMRMAEMAEAVAMSKSGATRLIDRLEQQGLVQRIPCPEDRRSVWACLTQKGIRRVKTIRPKYEAVVRQTLAEKLTRAEAAALAELLEKLVQA
jgi:DNA-binding MarR family transcriptional regulator